ncbi:hypothetical protein EYF80_062727 [Liparis tanakae]|uniref:C2 domain-containing protein n=1 Tax=Liparis tanakae TaxID=230148 RepID=A0A4Z2EE47_9TELE|nr:hypothetical protein EYF80_062727 [Liparis tanakae]
MFHPINVLGVTGDKKTWPPVAPFCCWSSSGSTSLGKTTVRRNNRNPWWEDEFSSYAAQVNEVLRLEVHDSDIGFDDLLGSCQRQIREGTHQHDCFLEEGGTLHYSYTLYT